MDLTTLIVNCSVHIHPAIIQAMAQISSANKPFTITVVGAQPESFKTRAEAAYYAHQQIARRKSVEIGLLGIPNRWLMPFRVQVNELLRPCKNTILASEILNQARLQCIAWKATRPSLSISACMLSVYKTGNPYQGSDYAQAVLTYAKQHPFSQEKKSKVASAPSPTSSEFIRFPRDS